jgi:hypothetical protein
MDERNKAKAVLPGEKLQNDRGDQLPSYHLVSNFFLYLGIEEGCSSRHTVKLLSNEELNQTFRDFD